MPVSWKRGKHEVREYFLRFFPRDSKILDIGPGIGTYSTLLRDEFSNMDAVEIHQPYIDEYDLHNKYGKVYNASVTDFPSFDGYDIVIMGDILEHLSVEDAQKVLSRMGSVSEVLIAVPYEYPQGASGVQSEIHLQDDLTRENFLERYPGFKELLILKKPKVVYGRPSRRELSGGYYVRDVPRDPLPGKSWPFEGPIYLDMAKTKFPA